LILSVLKQNQFVSQNVRIFNVIINNITQSAIQILHACWSVHNFTMAQLIAQETQNLNHKMWAQVSLILSQSTRLTSRQTLHAVAW